MKNTEVKNQVVRIDGNSELIAEIMEVMRLWNQTSGGGPEVSFATALRHVAALGARFERDRMLNAEFCFTTEQALNLHARKMVQGREPTHDEATVGRVNNPSPEFEFCDPEVS